MLQFGNENKTCFILQFSWFAVPLPKSKRIMNRPINAHLEPQSEVGQIKAWQTLSTEYLIRRPWLTARRDKVELPNGKIFDEYYVLEYPDWVNMIAVTDDGRMIIERQWRQALGEISLEIPAGVIEKGEKPIEAAQRELAEETGFTGGTWSRLLTIAPNSSTMSNRCHCFYAEGVHQTEGQHLDATEDLQVLFKSRKEVFDMLSHGEFHQAMMVAPLYKYFMLHPIR